MPPAVLEKNPVYKAINKPLTIGGTDRRLFFAVATTAAAIWNVLETLPGAAVVFFTGLFVARWITNNDPMLPRILLNAAKFRPSYDAAKRDC
jgi:type IV secretory pathway TrbD component